MSSFMVAIKEARFIQRVRREMAGAIGGYEAILEYGVLNDEEKEIIKSAITMLEQAEIAVNRTLEVKS